MRRSTIIEGLPIRPSEFVVEVGAGPRPYKYTKLIVDKYPFDNIERHGDIVNAAPLIKADAMKLPLADKACDVLFVSHVLEHLEEPEKFLQEARRCARRIYLEFPTFRRELMYAWSFHRWVIEIDEGRLMFYRNDIPQVFGDFFHSHYDFLLDAWSEERFEELNAWLFVDTDALVYDLSPRSALEHVLETSAKDEEKVNFPSQYGRVGTGPIGYPLRARVKTALWAMTPERLIRMRSRLAQKRNRQARRPLTGDIVGRLICQGCRVGSLRLEEPVRREIVSVVCGERYREVEKVFDFDV